MDASGHSWRAATYPREQDSSQLSQDQGWSSLGMVLVPAEILTFGNSWQDWRINQSLEKNN